MKKKILKYGLVVLAVALVLGGMFWMKDHYYRCAQRSEALGRYELAAQEYEQAGRYKDAEEMMAEESVSALHGEKATFLLQITMRRNASWQGFVDWMDGNPRQPFDSTLEFLNALDRQLTVWAAADQT